AGQGRGVRSSTRGSARPGSCRTMPIDTRGQGAPRPARPEDRMHDSSPHPRRPQVVRGATNPWVVVGLLWFCGFFNYADRQAIYSVFPLLKTEFGLSNTQQGWLGSVFMLVYAGASPFTGY